MQKLYTALFVILAFGSYAAMRTTQTAQAVAAVTPAAATPSAVPLAVPVATAPAATPSAPAIPVAPAPKATAPAIVDNTKKGKYTDGTYTGTSADAFYGQVQVRVTIASGRIADITFLSYPSDRRRSQQISESAMQGLVNQAIAVQSANVSGVSGATDTTAAFRESLSSALAQA